MKRIFCLLLMIFLLTGCSVEQEVNITMEQVIEVYEAKDYFVWTETYEPKEDGSIATVQVNHENGEFVIFTFFDTAKNAKAYAKSLQAPVASFFLSLMDPDLVVSQIESYGCICVEYYDEAYFAPFQSLLE